MAFFGLGSSSLLSRTIFMKNICINTTLERAKNDLKLGLPVLFHYRSKKYIILVVELLTINMLKLYNEIGHEIIMPKMMAQSLYNIHTDHGLRIKLNNCIESTDEMIKLATTHVTLPTSVEILEEEEHDALIIKFVKSAELLPSVLVANAGQNIVSDWCEQNNIVAIDALEMEGSEPSRHIKEVCRSPLILREAENTEIIIYKNLSKEHYCIIINDALTHSEPMVRIHSSCYTGDLLDSLSCDCGGQLRSTIKFLSENGGGIILYLLQEGRGIGLTNKIRTYAEQILNNQDTVEANASIGFADDERDFTIAANILKKLNITKIKLITNNLRKISQLQTNGITVISRIASIIEYNKYNMHYLHTKRNKLGHIINY